MLRYQPSRLSPSDCGLEIPIYKGTGYEDDDIRCVYCGNLTYEYESPKSWQVKFPTYEKFHRASARAMEREGLAPEPEHLKLRGSILEQRSSLHICPKCGWWVAVERALLPALRWQIWEQVLVSHTVLTELGLLDIDIPLAEVRNYLVRRYEARKTMHPRLFEQTVASVFADHGYTPQLTAYSNDGGIDVVLCSANGPRAGVQVKRQASAVEAEQIRAFLGALVLGGYERGVYVSTSRFTQGARKTATAAANKAVPIELVDAKSFYDLLGTAQLNNSLDSTYERIYRSPKPLFHQHTYCHLNSL